MQLSIVLSDLQVLEHQHKMTPSDSLWADLSVIHLKIQSLHSYEARASLTKCRKVFYTSGDKCGRILANALKEQRLRSHVPRVLAGRGVVALRPTEIADAFQCFYE